jgi:hypothetical protein
MKVAIVQSSAIAKFKRMEAGDATYKLTAQQYEIYPELKELVKYLEKAMKEL